MKNYRRNILSICLLSLLIILGFFLLTSGQPAALQSMSSVQTISGTAHAGDSNWAVLLGIAGLIRQCRTLKDNQGKISDSAP